MCVTCECITEPRLLSPLFLPPLLFARRSGLRFSVFYSHSFMSVHPALSSPFSPSKTYTQNASDDYHQEHPKMRQETREEQMGWDQNEMK